VIRFVLLFLDYSADESLRTKFLSGFVAWHWKIVRNYESQYWYGYTSRDSKVLRSVPLGAVESDLYNNCLVWNILCFNERNSKKTRGLVCWLFTGFLHLGVSIPFSINSEGSLFGNTDWFIVVIPFPLTTWMSKSQFQ
jgi:hypothetical protein